MKRISANNNRRLFRLAFMLLVLAPGMISVQGNPYGQSGSSNQEKNTRGKKLFLTTGLAIRKAVIVPAHADRVWEAWTTVKGVTSFFAPQASIELAVFGDYEMYFNPEQPEGQRGSEDCQILSFSPGEMLSFSWNAPTSMPGVRKERTWVVLNFQPQEGNKTRVTLIHLGWQMGKEWQDALKYFDKAWEVVLGRLQYRFQQGPIDWKKPFTPGEGK